MKNFKEYLTEAKKTYDFKIKIAGDVPADFESMFKQKFETLGIVEFKKANSTPVQKAPLDFPLLSNIEVTTWDLIVDYPVTTPRLTEELASLGLSTEYIRVKNMRCPSEKDAEELADDSEYNVKLLDGYYKNEPNPDNENFHGEKFVMDFLKSLEAESAERKKNIVKYATGDANGL